MNEDLFETFFEKIIILHNRREYDELRRILTGSCEKMFHKLPSNNGGAIYVDEDTISTKRVWIDNKTRKMLDILYYACEDENDVISLNNRMINLWLYEMNSEMSRFFYKAKGIECSREQHFTLKVENQTWYEFTLRCSCLNITIPEGFKACINDFIEQNVKIFI